MAEYRLVAILPAGDDCVVGCVEDLDSGERRVVFYEQHDGLPSTFAQMQGVFYRGIPIAATRDLLAALGEGA